jgi:hypothetical protein
MLPWDAQNNVVKVGGDRFNEIAHRGRRLWFGDGGLPWQ